MKVPMVVVVLVAPLLAAASACGGANQSTHDGTTVTLERPVDSSAPAPPAAPPATPTK